MAPLTDVLDQPSFDPVPPGAVPDPPPPRQWWGNHPGELRWQAELLRLLVDPVFRGEGVPRGNGQPVVLIPGFLAGDASLSVMRNWLTRLGYVPNISGITANVDCSDRAVDRLDARVARLHEETGKRVALIGHSRGGHFAKALARRRPDWISCVISLGSGLDLPFDISIPTRATVAAFRELHRLTSDRIARNGCFTESCRCQFAADFAADFPASVPLTSVYSKGDGVVWWEACVVPYATNVEVTGSHVGLAFNRKAYKAVAEALAAAPAPDASRPAAVAPA